MIPRFVKSCWFLILGFLIAITTLTPFGSFAYDEQAQTKVAYDGGQESSVGYDAGPELSTHKGKNRTTENSVPLSKSTEFLAAEGTGSLRLNLFGGGEAPGFVDTSTSANFANGRPLTSTFGNGPANDIFIRNAPITGDRTLFEIVRLSQPGTGCVTSKNSLTA